MRARAHALHAADDDTYRIGGVALGVLILLLVAAPLMRGGNRQVALIVLEALALVFLGVMFVERRRGVATVSTRERLLLVLFFSPLWLTVVYLTPLPPGLWNAAAGRAEYTHFLSAAGIAVPRWLPLSLAPQATMVSLLAGIPLMAAFLAGYAMSLRQLRIAFAALAVVASTEVIFGMLQLAGGTESSLYFGATHRGAFGTFANTNHFANYLAMALAGYIWLAWCSISDRRGRQRHRHGPARMSVVALWTAGGLLLVVGILMSRSRGAILTGLPAGLAAFALAVLVGSQARALRASAVLITGALLVTMALVGFDSIVSRFSVQQIAVDLPLRTMQSASTMTAAAHYWPWGSGWGTYLAVYPRFQPAALVGIADYAHQDYAQMLMEGGVFAALLAVVFLWLAVTRSATLLRTALRRRSLRRHEMAVAVCGLGLLGFLLHSFLEFNMHIPANAIAAALLTGVFLRPLDPRQVEEETYD